MHDALFHLNRLLRMVWFKGPFYTARYVWFNLLFQSAWVARLIVNTFKLYKYPTYLEVEVSTRCNLRCIMCEHTYWKERPSDMSFESFKKIIDQFPRIHWIGLTGIGTALLNKDYLKMLRYVKEQRNAYVEIYESCNLVDECVAKEFIDVGLDRIIVSLDAATKETYEKIRVGADFERVVRNIKGLVRMREGAGRHYPEITFHYIISTINKKEMIDFIRLVHSLGLGATTEIAFTVILRGYDQIKGMVPDLSEHEIDEANKMARTLGLRVNWNKNTSERESIGKCTEWTMPFIFVDGTVIPCCGGNESNKRELQRILSLGNVFEKGFREIWNGPEYHELRQKVWNGKVPKACKICNVYKI
jgi:MoaA/NifB/PqqE/SkfB family radical SAM enzyme